jgi:IS30 family transposase
MNNDHAKEITEHERFTMDSKMQVHFANPISPWTRGANEITNGLIRNIMKIWMK